MPNPQSPVTLLDVFVVTPEKQQALVDIEIQANAVVKRQPGYISATIYRSLDGTKVTSEMRFESREAFEAMLQNPEIRQFIQQAARVAESFTAVLYEAAFTDK